MRRGKWSLTTAAALAAPRFVITPSGIRAIIPWLSPHLAQLRSAQASGTSGGIEERGVGRDTADEGGVEEGAALAGAGEPHRLPWVNISVRS